MPFPPTGSVISTDLDNMMRGLARDNSDHAVSGPITETTLASTTVSANTIGPTGSLLVIAAGSASGAGGGKTIKIYFGASVMLTLAVPAGTQCWYIKMWHSNTSTNAQRMFIESGSIPAAVGSSAAPVLNFSYATSAVDTTQNQTLKVTTTNANAGDTCTQSMWEIFVAQIT
jgi:hypothetical protein